MRYRSRACWVLAGLVLGLAQPACAQSKSRGPSGSPLAWFSPDDYPPEALRAGDQGRVIAEVQIDDTGKVVSCKVVGSSGSASLDQKTCTVALEDRHFEPAVDQKGRPIASHTQFAVRWAIPAGHEFGDPIDVTVGPPAIRTMEMTVTLAGDGTLEGCHADLTGRKPGEIGDPCDRMKVGTKVSAGFSRAGRPVGARIVTRLSEQVLLDP